ncbi:NAD(P)-binding protein [Auriculariales sp. MPI-PUGE-AT-0066]|nr:NAD(P)-binding protein [Auriculariales sp. MPI-PUGE-AT-0066]
MTITGSSAPLVVVVGATGQQGSSVVAALKSSSQIYRVRALTRDTSKPAAQALAAVGAELVQANLTVDNEVEVRKAFAGADIAFIVTNFWEHMDMAREIAEAKMMIDAAELGGAKRIIWSGLQSMAEASKGKYTKVVHFEGKAQVTEYGRAKFAATDVAFVNVDAGFYAQNFLAHPMLFRKDPWTLVMGGPPSLRLPIIDIRDYGKWVVAAIEDPTYASGGEIIAAAEYVTAEEVVSGLSKATGKEIKFHQSTPAETKAHMESLGMPDLVVDDMLDTNAAFNDPTIGYYGSKELTKIANKPNTWKEFVAGYNWEGVFA